MKRILVLGCLGLAFAGVGRGRRADRLLQERRRDGLELPRHSRGQRALPGRDRDPGVVGSERLGEGPGQGPRQGRLRGPRRRSLPRQGRGQAGRRAPAHDGSAPGPHRPRLEGGLRLAAGATRREEEPGSASIGWCMGGRYSLEPRDQGAGPGRGRRLLRRAPRPSPLPSPRSRPRCSATTAATTRARPPTR